MYKALFTLFASLAMLAFLSAQTPDTIPFTLTPANNISVQGVLNDTDTLELMLHTAASGMTLTREATARMGSFELNGADTVSSWGGANASRYSTGNQLQIGGQQWADLQIWENENSGPGTDGKFGLGFFADRIVTIDFDQRHLIISDELPADLENFRKVPVRFDDSFLFLEGALTVGDSTWTNTFLIHSGFGGSLLLDDVFVADHQLSETLEIIKTSILKDSYGNEIKTQKAVLPEFQVDPIVFKDIPIGFFAGSIGRQKMSVIGGDLLKRFNIIFDLLHDEVYLAANTLKTEDFQE